MAVNTGNVIKGGLVAGVVNGALGYLVFGVLMKDSMKAQFDALNPTLSDKMNATPAIVGQIALGFVTSILMVWTYAAIRATYGPGPGTASRVGLLFWTALATVYLGDTLGGMYSMHFFLAACGVTLITTLITVNAGCAVYKE